MLLKFKRFSKLIKERKRDEISVIIFALWWVSFLLIWLVNIFTEDWKKGLEFIAFWFALYSICQWHNSTIEGKKTEERLSKKIDQLLQAINNQDNSTKHQS